MTVLNNPLEERRVILVVDRLKPLNSLRFVLYVKSQSNDFLFVCAEGVSVYGKGVQLSVTNKGVDVVVGGAVR